MPRRSKRGEPAPQEQVVGVFPIVIEGNIRTLPAQIEDGNYQPSIALWVDARTSLVLAFQLIDPRETPDGGVSEARTALQGALASPMLGALVEADGQAPVLVRTSVQLAAALVPDLPEHVRIESATDLPIFDEVFSELADTLLKAAPQVSAEPFAWDIDPVLLKPLFKAAAEYARRQPWTFLPDDPPLAVVLGAASPLEGVDTLYGSVLGGGGQVYGIAYYLSLDEYRNAQAVGTELELEDEEYEPLLAQLRATGVPVDEVPPEMVRQMMRSLRAAADDEAPALGDGPRQEALACLLDPYEEADPDYLGWLEERQIAVDPEQWVPTFVRTARELPPREPNERETQALTLALAATNQFLSKHRHLLRRIVLPDGGLHHVAQVGGKTRGVAIEVHMPPAGYEYARDLSLLDSMFEE